MPEPITPEFSVVMPCLNEARTVGACIAKAFASFDDLDVQGEVVVADNGSTDGSQGIAAERGARVVSVAERGYGAALAAGIAASRGMFVIMGDADDTYDFARLDGFVTKLREGYDLVVGNRFSGGVEPGAMPFLHRYVGNPALTRIGRRLFGLPVGDVYCGLRGFRRSSVLALRLRSPGMEFALEMIVKARLGGQRITEVPTTLVRDRRDRPPHLRTWRDGWRSLRFFLLYSPRWLLLYPGLLLMVTGLMTMLWLLPGSRRVGSITFDVHTLLYAGVAVLVGFQAVVFALFSRLFAVREGFLPETPRLAALGRFVTLERGLLAGLLLLGVGLALSVAAVVTWTERSFGVLNYPDTMRLVIPAVVLIALGSQTIVVSLFFSVLGVAKDVVSPGE
jgi:glycosyltransferase involved in cell wall biosynthesis